MPGHHDFSIQLTKVALRAIHHHDIAIQNQGAHRRTAHTEATRRLGVWAPQRRNRRHLGLIQPSKMTSFNSRARSFTYDAFGRVMETTFPSTHYEQYGYDAANNLTSKTDRKGQTINYVYDDLYRLTQKTYPDSSTVEYVYDL